MSTIHETTQRTAGHIRQPFTLLQICEIVMTGEYNADLMLQHLLLCADSLERENAQLRKGLAEADVLHEYGRDDGRREWAVVETWIRRGDIIVQMDRAAFDAARKETQP